jgi:hypothetical protein
MNPTRTALVALMTTCLLAPGALRAQDSGLLQCRAQVEPAARLACYDALPVSAAKPAPSAAASAGAPATASSAAPAVPPEKQFGLPTPADLLDSVSTRYEGLFEGWRANERIRLANGQVWQVVDDSSAVYELKSPKVTIRRGAFGRFVLDIEGAAKMPGVRRVQ